jgi:hypothetical protein
MRRPWALACALSASLGAHWGVFGPWESAARRMPDAHSGTHVSPTAIQVSVGLRGTAPEAAGTGEAPSAQPPSNAPHPRSGPAQETAANRLGAGDADYADDAGGAGGAGWPPIALEGYDLAPMPEQDWWIEEPPAPEAIPAVPPASQIKASAPTATWRAVVEIDVSATGQITAWRVVSASIPPAQVQRLLQGLERTPMIPAVRAGRAVHARFRVEFAVD